MNIESKIFLTKKILQTQTKIIQYFMKISFVSKININKEDYELEFNNSLRLFLLFVLFQKFSLMKTIEKSKNHNCL